MHCILQAPEAGSTPGVTGLVSTTLHLETLAAEPQHLGHERKTVEPSVLVERRQDLVLGSNLDEVSRAQVRGVGL